MIGSEARVYYVHRAKEASGGRETARHEKQRERTACSAEGRGGTRQEGGGRREGGTERRRRRRRGGREAGQRRDDRGLTRWTIGGDASSSASRTSVYERTRARERDKDAERNARE